MVFVQLWSLSEAGCHSSPTRRWKGLSLWQPSATKDDKRIGFTRRTTAAAQANFRGGRKSGGGSARTITRCSGKTRRVVPSNAVMLGAMLSMAAKQAGNTHLHSLNRGRDSNPRQHCPLCETSLANARTALLTTSLWGVWHAWLYVRWRPSHSFLAGDTLGRTALAALTTSRHREQAKPRRPCGAQFVIIVPSRRDHDAMPACVFARPYTK